MKKISFFVFITIAFWGTVQAQTFGIKGGVNFSSISDYSYGAATGKSLIGFHAGGLVNVTLSKKWAFQQELVYSIQGARQKYNSAMINPEDPNGNPIVTQKSEQKNTYLNLPVVVQYYPLTNVFVEAGPQIGFLLASKYKVEDASRVLAEFDSKQDFKSVNVSLGFGGGYQFKKFPIGVNARYNVALNGVNKASNKMKNNVFQTTVFYKLKNTK